MNKLIIFISLLLISIPLHAASTPKEHTSTAQDQQKVAITIYNQNLALVKDTRKIKLDRSLNRLAWREVSAKMRSETALLRNLTQPDGFKLIEQNFDFDLLTPQKLLEKYTNREITVIRTNPATGEETREKATVLATNNGVVLKFADRIETGVPGRIAFSGVPENLRDKPTLVATFMNPAKGQNELELSYLTGGLSWRADYVAELNAEDSHIDLNGLVTLTNQSGAAYPNAKLQLVAGDVNRVSRPERSYLNKSRVAMAQKMDMGEAMQEESLFEYHLYTLQFPTTLADNQTKQVALMSATQVPIEKEFLLQGHDYYYSGQYNDIGSKLKTGVFIKFQNKGKGLGIPLPKGIMRVYKKDQKGNVQFVGEDNIDHTPDREHIRLKLGDAFDITAEKKQTDFKRLKSSKNTYLYESAYQITLKNAKKEPVTVTVREPIPGDWQVLNESQSHEKVSAYRVEWKVTIPPKSKKTLDYRVRVKM